MKPCQQRRQGRSTASRPRPERASSYEPASSNQSRALIKCSLNCLSDSSNSGLEGLLLERRELWPERAAAGRFGKGARTGAIVMLAIEKELGDNAKMQASLGDQMSSSMSITWRLMTPVQR